MMFLVSEVKSSSYVIINHMIFHYFVITRDVYNDKKLIKMHKG